MKRIILLFTLAFLGFGLTAQTITRTYHFSQPVLEETSDGYTIINYDGCFNYGPEGHPLLPHKGVNLLLPQGQSIAEVKILSENYYETKENIRIKPAERQFPLSRKPDRYKVVPDEEIYSFSGIYPENIIEDDATYFLSGHGIGSFTICPVRYNPAKSEVTFLESITVEVITQSSGKATDASAFLNNKKATTSRISKIVENPELQKEYEYPELRSSDEADILLISDQTLLPEFNTYISFKESTGFIVKTETTEDIYANYSGDDSQDKIRNCIIDYVQNYGITWVILGGDADPDNAAEMIIPHRGFYCNAYGTVDEDIPADIYYSNLDGTWDSDNDNKYGEPGEEDLYAEVSIGRFCIDSPEEVSNMTQKHIRYQDAPVLEDIEKSLFLGEMLWPEPTWGGDYKDEVAFGSSNHGYTTVGLSTNFNITFLYERDGYWDKNDVFDQYSNVGVNLRNHLGHSGTTYNMLMNNPDLTTTNFTNDGISRGLVIGYSQGCYNGAFDNRETYAGMYVEDCFSEKITTIETAEVANIGNSRYGWGQHMSTNGASQYFDRQFFDAIFGEDITMIGEANRDSKEDNVSYINSLSGAIRWCFYELTLFGDPTMDIWTAQPTPIVASYPMALAVGTQSVNFQTDAPGARIGLVQDGVLIGRGLADNSGNLNLQLFDMISSLEPIQVSVIAHNRSRHLGNIIVIDDEPYVVYESHIINDSAGNNNGVIEFGETIFMEMTVKNVGMVDASNVMVALKTNEIYVAMNDSLEDFGTIPSGETKTIYNAFSINISNNVPDNYLLDFEVVAESDTSWSSYFSNLAFGPELNILDMVIDDSQGNNNGRLDPGETALIKVKNKNTGHCLAENCIGSMSSNCYFLEWQNVIDTIGNMSQLGHYWAEYEVTVDPEAPNGVIIADLNYTLTSCAYQANKLFKRKLGLLVEDFETANFSKFNWQFAGDVPWEITSSYPYEGIYSAKSGNIGHAEESEIYISMKIMTADSISFIKKVSSEQDLDKLRFYINDNLKAEWSGNYQGWTRESFYVPVGQHEFKWVYSKDGANSAGADQAWLDFIIFPPEATLTCYAGPDDSSCIPDPFQCEGQATSWTSCTWSTSGTGTFSNPNILRPQYTPSQEDVDAGNVELTITVVGEGTQEDDEMTLTFTDVLPAPTQPEGPEYVDVYSTPISEYTTTEVTGAWAYEWYIYPEDAGIIEGTGLYASVKWNASYLGETMISVSSVNECGAGFPSQELEVIVDNTVGIVNDTKGENELAIIPNPNNGQFLVEFGSNDGSERLFNVVNILGEVLLNEKIGSNVDSRIMNLTGLENGIYFAIMQTGNNKIVRKIIINK